MDELEDLENAKLRRRKKWIDIGVGDHLGVKGIAGGVGLVIKELLTLGALKDRGPTEVTELLLRSRGGF